MPNYSNLPKIWKHFLVELIDKPFLNKNLLLPSKYMIRRVIQLDIFGVDKVIWCKSILSSTYKTTIAFLFALIIIVHISSTRSASRYFICWPLNWIHLKRNWWDKSRKRHSVSIIYCSIARKVSIAELIGWRVVLGILCKLLKLLFSLYVLLCDFSNLMLSWAGGHVSVALRTVGKLILIWCLFNLLITVNIINLLTLLFLPSLFEESIDWHFNYLFIGYLMYILKWYL